ncbi:MAG: YbhB/YbcL family Raf kinase inhibitor-like protein [Myxococcota bacterium]
MMPQSFRLSFLTAMLAFPGLASAADFELRSDDVAEGQPLDLRHVFRGFGCEGENLSPQLSWSGAPAKTKSFVVTVYDPDAPTGSGWWHWTAFDLPARTRSLPRGARAHGGLPKSAKEARNDYGAVGFGGACPPPGEVHRYVFTVYALDVPELSVPEGASNALIGFMTRAHALATARITAIYTR